MIQTDSIDSTNQIKPEEAVQELNMVTQGFTLPLYNPLVKQALSKSPLLSKMTNDELRSLNKMERQKVARSQEKAAKSQDMD